MPHKRKLLACWVVAGAFELPFTMLVLGIPVPWLDGRPSVALAAHVCAALVLALAGAGKRGGLRANPWSAALFMAAVWFPFFGWLGALAFLAYREPRLEAVPEPDEYGPGLPSFEASRPKSSPSAVILKELDFIPLADILRGDDADLKRGAIERLAEIRTPDAVGLLLAHRSDPSMEVRFHVTAALTRLRREMDEQLEAARLRLGTGQFTVDSRMALAKKYLDYSRSRLLDGATLDSYRAEAISHLEAAIGAGTAPLEAYRLLEDALEERGDLAGAFAALDAWRGRPGADPAEIARLRAGLLFRAGRYADMREQLRHTAGAGDTQWAALAQWWGASG